MLVLLQDTLEESMEVVIEDYVGEMTNEEFKDNLKELTELKIGSRTSFPFFPFHMQGINQTMKFCKCLKTNLVSRNLLFWVFAKKQQLPPLCSHPFRSNNHFTFQFSVKGGDGKNWEVHSHAPQL